jgi:hypothetical protein
MIHHSPIISVDVAYTDNAVSSLYVKFLDQTEATYDAAADIHEVFRRLAEQQKMIELSYADQGAVTQGTSA